MNYGNGMPMNGQTGYLNQGMQQGYTGQVRPSGGTAQGYSGASAYNESMAYSRPYVATPADMPKKREAAKKTEKPRAKSSSGGFGKKLAITVLCGLLFGAIAGGMIYLIAGKKLASLKESGQQVSYNAPIPTTNVVGDGVQTSLEFDVADIAESAMPSVVAITIKSIQEVPTYFGFYQEYESEGSGSGIIIGQNENELLIVTNNHVVAGATSVSVAFIDGGIGEAKVKGTDPNNDLAVIVVPLDQLTDETKAAIKTAKIGNSDELKVGEQVVAIGNALGYGQSVTTGIVSALNRMNSTNDTPLIQTDAAINPGNSGGALLNMKGEIVGINSSKYSNTSVEGMGYAIPISAVQDIINNLTEMKTRTKLSQDDRGYLGIEGSTVQEQTIQEFGVPAGVMIESFSTDSPAKTAGLQKGDVITKLDGKDITANDQLLSELAYYEPGEVVTITYYTPDGSSYVEKSAQVTLTHK